MSRDGPAIRGSAAKLLGPAEQARFIKRGLLKPEEAIGLLQDASGNQVIPHSGSVTWNAFRRRFVLIAVERFGSSALGEIWYAEASAANRPVESHA